MICTNEPSLLEVARIPVRNHIDLFKKASAIHRLFSTGTSFIQLNQLTHCPVPYLLQLYTLHESTSLTKALVIHNFISARVISEVLADYSISKSEILLLYLFWTARKQQKVCNLSFIKQMLTAYYSDHRRITERQREILMDYLNTDNQAEFFSYLDRIFANFTPHVDWEPSSSQVVGRIPHR